jgi:hypothetical protein
MVTPDLGDDEPGLIATGYSALRLFLHADRG